MLYTAISEPVHYFHGAQSHLHCTLVYTYNSIIISGFIYKLPVVAKEESNSTRLFLAVIQKSGVRLP